MSKFKILHCQGRKAGLNLAIARLEAGLNCRHEQVLFLYEYDNLSTGTAQGSH